MPKNREDLKIFYIQIREDQETRDEELSEFMRFGGLKKEQFTILNVFDTPNFTPEQADGHDAVFVGGSSDANVLDADKYAFINPSMELMRYCVEKSIPTFASCFGFQVAAVALGGDAKVDKENMETGSYTITLTEAAKDDLLFHDMPHQFEAIAFHKVRVTELPPGAIHLAKSERCPMHAFTMEGKPFYTTQFHPELDRTDLIARIARYADRYYTPEEKETELARIDRECAETPEANSLIGKFVERILLAK